METFYLTVNGGTDLLMMDGTNIWAFQTGSVEGPPGTYTITPNFDTTLIDIPSDIDVYYSLTGGATWVAAGYDPITNPTFDVTASAGTTLLAQLRYTADGSAVQRLNLSNILEDVPTVSLVLGVAPTFNGTPSASATNPTVGDSVSVLTYSASGTPTPTVTFEWFVDAVSQAETTDTFDTTGLSGGETLTCTVTASNGVSPDATANVNFGTVAAAGATYSYTLSGSLQDDGSTAGVPRTTNNISSPTESGNAVDDFQYYASGPLRIDSVGTTGEYIDFYFQVTNTGMFADWDAFIAGSTNRSASITIGGTLLEGTGSFSKVAPITGLYRVTGTSNFQSFWNATSSGDSFVFSLSFD